MNTQPPSNTVYSSGSPAGTGGMPEQPQSGTKKKIVWIGIVAVIFVAGLLLLWRLFFPNAAYLPATALLPSGAEPPVPTGRPVSFAADHIIVKFKAGTQANEAFLKKYQLSSAHKLIEGTVFPEGQQQGLDRLHIITLPSAANIEAVVNALSHDPNVEYAEPDFDMTLTGMPNDTSFPLQWDFHNTGQGGGTPDADIDAPEAWDISTGNRNVIVAVIDTGIEYTHPDLAQNIWTNAGEIAGNGVDDDHDGYVDDVHGYDFVNHDGDPIDDHSHGTHIAGTIAAVSNNNQGVSGIAWNAQLMPLKFLDALAVGATSDGVSALNFAVSHGAVISNNSWGCVCYSSSLNDAITAARAAGHIFVAAAGNNSSNNDTTAFYPASYTHDNVVSVAATDRFDNLASFSNYGSTSVDIAAPGFSIYSTGLNQLYTYKSGTSMASPHVAGALAVLRSHYTGDTYKQLIDRLLQTVDPLPSLSGKVVSGGRLNLASALGAPVPSSSSTPSATPTPTATTTPTATPTATPTPTPPPIIDTTPPTVSISSPANNATLGTKGTTSFTATAQDSSGIKTITLLVNTGVVKTCSGATSCSYSINLNKTSSGTYTLTAKATDNSTKANQATKSITVVKP